MYYQTLSFATFVFSPMNNFSTLILATLRAGEWVNSEETIYAERCTSDLEDDLTVDSTQIWP